tara:strand:- start:519 stop:914 length:396 start_codon:yes stop_codon:yes gene_type:complete
MIKLLTVEYQSNKKIFELIDDFNKFLDSDNWMNKLIFWELDLLKLIGYDLELKNIVKEEHSKNKKLYYVVSNNEKRYIPNFLIEKDNNIVDHELILSGLKIISDYLEKSILRPNNISHPKPRIEFLNTIKQ